MNLPTRLTVLRIFLSFLLLPLIIWPGAGVKALALIVFIIACVTDYLDGYWARSRNLCSTLGAFLDPLADKILVIGAFLGFVQLGLIPAWLVLLVLARDFLISALRLVAAERGKVIAANLGGKAKTVAQMVAVGLSVLFLGVRELGILQGQWSAERDALLNQSVFLLVAVAVLLTVISGAQYWIANRSVLYDSAEKS
ncbi:MAG: CDP-diacylglycerol--glycerol-3-phosphate 3-phosphatidyltransferase [Candidatus Omnitrophica bacterium]|nr:CDP-diacylglycerol--glycerol-3-phosphate 3-phosphatidyltransferase [Candidatus Omnitrophota bacterium]